MPGTRCRRTACDRAICRCAVPGCAAPISASTPGSALDAEGWFSTGDVASIDPDGYMEITDRSKDVIKSGGEWISSIQLENIAVSHPDVAEAAIVAAKHPKWDERPLLIVVAKPDRSIDKDDLLRVYEGKVPKWWLPDDVVVVDGTAAHRHRQAAEERAARTVPELSDRERGGVGRCR